MTGVYTFSSPVNTNEMVGIITRVVTAIGGKSRVSGDVVTASWYSRRFMTVLPQKFVFYVGKDMVRVVTSCAHGMIAWNAKLGGPVRLWDDFVIALEKTYPKLDFQIKSGDYHIVSAKIMSDGIEQTFVSKSINRPSIGGALVGSMLFGDIGALIGASAGTTMTSGRMKTVFSQNVLVLVRYSNGLIVEGSISKKSGVYNLILANMSELDEH